MDLWYIFNLWPFTRRGMFLPCIVLIFTAPLLKTSSISYGPSQWVWNFPWKSLNFESNNSAQSPALYFFSLIYLSCHLALCCWIILVLWTSSCLISSSSLSYSNLCFCASDKSNPNWISILKVLLWNSIGNMTCFP